MALPASDVATVATRFCSLLCWSEAEIPIHRDKRRHFCPSCHQKRVVEFGEYLCEEVLKAVPHRHFIFSIPKMLRRYFLGACPGPDPGTADFSLILVDAVGNH